MSLMKGPKGTDMKFQILALFLLLFALPWSANAADGLCFYIECSPGRSCIDLAYESGRIESAIAGPAQVVEKSDVRSATVQSGPGAAQSLVIDLGEEASDKLAKITRENVGKKLIVALDDRILTAPEIREPVTAGRIIINGEHGRFWEKTPWLQDLIKDSRTASSRSVKTYVVIALAFLIAAVLFVLFPRIRRAA